MYNSKQQFVDVENKTNNTNVETKPVANTLSKRYSNVAAVIQQKNMAIADSGTTGHFLKIDSQCVDKRQTNEGLDVRLPDGSVIKSTHTALLNIPHLPMKARQAHLFPDIS